jgi:hypothetical protein
MTRIRTSVGPSSGSSSNVNTVTGSVNFWPSTGQEGDIASTTVSAPWVTLNSIITCSVQLVATADHSVDEIICEDIEAWAENVVPGVGFDIVALAPQNTFGSYMVQAISVN